MVPCEWMCSVVLRNFCWRAEGAAIRGGGGKYHCQSAVSFVVIGIQTIATPQGNKEAIGQRKSRAGINNPPPQCIGLVWSQLPGFPYLSGHCCSHFRYGGSRIVNISQLSYLIRSRWGSINNLNVLNHWKKGWYSTKFYSAEILVQYHPRCLIFLLYTSFAPVFCYMHL